MASQKVIKSSGYGRSKSKGTALSTSSTKPERSIKSNVLVPALSVPPKVKPGLDPILEKLKKKTVRRNAPAEEDIKKIREIIKSLNAQAVTVQEFVGLVSPYTGDGGKALRTVMGDDLLSFRKLAKRVYDQMTQDMSDVLANEQINLNEFYKDKCNGFQFKMMKILDEIHSYVPKFSFDNYFKDEKGYLENHFPIPQEESLDPEAEELERRQLLFHRLMWLRTEGTRLGEENKQLQARLKELQRQQRDEVALCKKQEEMAEARKNQLESTEANLKAELKELSESVNQTLVAKEEALRIDTDSTVFEEASKKQLYRSKTPRTRTDKKEPWNVKAAKEIEKKSFAKAANDIITTASASITSVSTKGAKKKTIPKSKPKKQTRDKSPFHYSPPKSPPRVREKQVSPFHYSPPKSPITSPFHYSPLRSPVVQDRPTSQTRSPSATVSVVEVESSTTTIDRQSRQSRQIPNVRRNLAPKDTWGGFK